MIAVLAGKLLAVGEESIVVDVHGVGFEVYVPASLLGGHLKSGEEITLYTHLHVREDDLSLYGFENEIQRELFLEIVSVSRIGPSLGLSVLSELTAREFRSAIIHRDRDQLTAIRGIGKKTAERLILELKEKFEREGEAFLESPDPREPLSDVVDDAAAALQNLGYSQKEAEKLIGGAYAELKEDGPGGEPELEELVRAALARVNPNRN